MSELKVSPEAIIHIKEIIASRAVAWPVIMVDWSSGPGDVTRGPAGEVLWEREPASWKVWVHDMAMFYELAVSPDQRTIDEGDGGIFRATIPSPGKTGESGTIPLYARFCSG